MGTRETKEQIIKAGRIAIEELVKVAQEAIVGNENQEDLSADKLKSAAATKKLAIFDAFEILSRIEEEESMISGKPLEKHKTEAFKGFAEKRSK